MESQQDPLFKIFRQHLNEALLSEESSEEALIDAVVKEYMQILNGRGFVPTRLHKFLEQDAREEVVAMLRKTTYGHFSLAEFSISNDRLAHRLKSRGS